MAYVTKNLDTLTAFLPEKAYPLVSQYLKHYKVGLTITKDRKSRYGDYTFDTKEKRHKISVNGTLNQYEFLVTLLHELAHLITFRDFQYRVSPHGKEWKHNFSRILNEFINLDVFPSDITQALNQHIKQVKATQCRDLQLSKVLQSYNEHPATFVADIGIGQIFATDRGDRFKVLEKLRTRYKCMDLKTKRIYLFPALYEVHPIPQLL